MADRTQNLTFSGNPTTFNETLYNNPTLCTLSTCPKQYATLEYVPSIGANAFFLVVFTIALIAQVSLGLKYRAWTFLFAMFFGCLGELIGYIGRILMHNNIFDFNWFLMYLICLTISPCLYTAAIYLTFTRLTLLFGPHLARLKPKTYTYVFIAWDLLSLVLQAAGGAMASEANNGRSGQTGINIMIAGLSSQVASLVVFILFCGDFALRAWENHRRPGASSRAKEGLAKLGSTVGWLQCTIGGLIIAVLTIFIRSCYRVAELREGFGGHLANDQATFIGLEGVMVMIAAVALTVAHPCFVFRRSWQFKKTEALLSTDSPSASRQTMKVAT